MSEQQRTPKEAAAPLRLSRRRFAGTTAQGLAAVAGASLVGGCVVFQVDLAMAVQSIQDFAGSIPLMSSFRSVKRGRLDPVARRFPLSLRNPAG